MGAGRSSNEDQTGVFRMRLTDRQIASMLLNSYIATLFQLDLRYNTFLSRNIISGFWRMHRADQILDDLGFKG